jgi:uncharacterized protein
MYSLLLRLFLFLSAFWLFRKLLAFFMGSSPQKGNSNSWKECARPSNDTVKDPVCGMYMDPRLAIRLESKDKLLYFCSDECRQKYLALHT